MKAYRVTHKKSGDRYFVLAESDVHAIEIVEMRIGDPERAGAWDAAAETPEFDLKEGTLYDRSGKAVAPWR